MNVPAASKRGSADVMPSSPNSSSCMDAHPGLAPAHGLPDDPADSMFVVPDE